jgi:hypothetical protein
VPYQVEFLADGGVFAKASGVVTAAEIEAAKAKAVQTSGESGERSYLLVDTGGATEFIGGAPEVQGIAYSSVRVAPLVFRPGARAAIVAPSDLAFGLARMWEVYMRGSGLTTRVFRSLSDAKIWVVGGEIVE